MTPTIPKTALSFVDAPLTLYCEKSTSDEPQVCRQMRERAHSHPKSHWISGPLVGTFLKMIVALTKAKQVLDIGTYYGYSAAYMASAHPDVIVTSLEHDADFASEAKAIIGGSPFADRIHIKNVDANAWLVQAGRCEFDVIFFDSNRNNLMGIYEALISSLKVGGILIMDNACLRGKVLSPNRPWEHDTVAFNSAIQQNQSFITTLLPIRDGLLLAHKVS